MTGETSKVKCCNEQYCIGTWNARFRNQGKVKVVKQGMARVNTDILGISELKWTGMGEFSSDDHDISYCGQEFLGRNEVVVMVNKRIWNAVLGCSLINTLISVIQVFAPSTIAKEWSQMVLWSTLRLASKNNIPIVIIRCTDNKMTCPIKKHATDWTKFQFLNFNLDLLR